MRALGIPEIAARARGYLRSLRRRARSHAAQTAFALAQGAEDIRAYLEDRAARNDESIRAARRAIKSARVGRAEHEWLARHAHSAAHAPTQAL